MCVCVCVILSSLPIPLNFFKSQFFLLTVTLQMFPENCGCPEQLGWRPGDTQGRCFYMGCWVSKFSLTKSVGAELGKADPSEHPFWFLFPVRVSWESHALDSTRKAARSKDTNPTNTSLISDSFCNFSNSGPPAWLSPSPTLCSACPASLFHTPLGMFPVDFRHKQENLPSGHSQ